MPGPGSAWAAGPAGRDPRLRIVRALAAGPGFSASDATGTASWHHCHGGSLLTADMIRCGSCSNTGQRPGAEEAEERLLDTVIEKLPDSFERTRLELLSTISGPGTRDGG